MDEQEKIEKKKGEEGMMKKQFFGSKPIFVEARSI